MLQNGGVEYGFYDVKRSGGNLEAYAEARITNVPDGIYRRRTEDRHGVDYAERYEKAL